MCPGTAVSWPSPGGTNYFGTVISDETEDGKVMIVADRCGYEPFDRVKPVYQADVAALTVVPKEALKPEWGNDSGALPGSQSQTPPQEASG